MARRRRRKFSRRQGFNLWIIIFQIAILIALLVAILAVRDSVGTGTSVIVDSLTSEDIAVDGPAGDDDGDISGQRTDDTIGSEDQPMPDAGLEQEPDADDGEANSIEIE